MYVKGLQTFYGQGPHQLVYAVSRAAHRKMSISGIPSRTNYYEIIVAYTKFSNVATGHNTTWQVTGWKPMV